MYFERINGTAINITSVTVNSGGFDTVQLSFSPPLTTGNPITFTGNPFTPQARRDAKITIKTFLTIK